MWKCSRFPHVSWKCNMQFPRGVGTRSFRQPTSFISDYRTKKKTTEKTTEKLYKLLYLQASFFFLHNFNVLTVWDQQGTWNLVTIVQLHQQNEIQACIVDFYWSNMSQSKKHWNIDMVICSNPLYSSRGRSSTSVGHRNFRGFWLHLHDLFLQQHQMYCLVDSSTAPNRNGPDQHESS